MKIADSPHYIGVSRFIETKLENTAEALATYIVHAGQHRDIHIISADDDVVLNTTGVWIDKCCDSEFLAELKEVLNPKIEELLKMNPGFGGFPLKSDNDSKQQSK